ncbi:MAG TPA: outer membrane beta-barrel protein [Opitutaceae bacterium]
MNKKLYPICLCAVSLLATSGRAQTTTTTTTTTPATPTPAAVAAAPAAPAAAPTSPVSTPAMEGPLAVNVKPESFDIPDFGKIYVSGALTGLAFAENNPYPGDRKYLADVSNAQIFVQKVDGAFQFFLQGGVYSLPSLGAGYLTAGTATTDLYGPLPQAFAKIVSGNFSIEAGKLPTLVGAEYTFTFENMNIFRGLLWNQETAVSRGIQANYTAGPVALSVSWNDGFYSDRFNWLSGSAAWTISSSSTLALVVAGNLGTTDYSNSLATPLVQNNDQQLDNLIYSYINGPVILQAYVQYAEAKANAYLGYTHSGSTTGWGVLANYAVPNTSVNLSGRVEYITSSGSLTDGSPNLLYGPGSNAWSFTFTPSYQSGVLFTRAEASIVQTGNATDGLDLGPSLTNHYQFRFAVEAGILF